MHFFSDLAMSIHVAVRDETSSGEILHETVVNLLSVNVTAREIIRERILQEVGAYNRGPRERVFPGFVTPTATEAQLNARVVAKAPTVDWRKQFEIACAAFERNGFLILVDDRQIEDLDDEIEVHPETTVSFLKLVPLVGG